MTACPTCQRENPEGARFCAFCGTPLEAAAPLREERKVVSVVFVDLVGHTARSESADPEDVRALLAPYHAKARKEIERFGGTVEKFIGDAVMAVFGAPTAHEDDAERAVRAALAVRDAFVEEHLDVRIAVNTGEALVTVGARPEAGEGMVAGDVVNTAARLQSAAPVNGVLVGAATREATERVIEYRDAPAIDAKGKAAPVAAWEALAPRARQGIDARQAVTPLVGRDAERRALVDAVDRAAHDRSLQLLTLVGAPGMGKSRLVLEVYGELDARPGLVATWRQGRALAYGGGAFGAIGDVVRAEAGILETDDADTASERLRAAVDGLTDDDVERGWLHRRLLPLVAEQAEQASRDESYGAWQRFFELIAERLALVLVLEDLHWADDGTLDFVEHLADWSTDSPLFILCTARPELLERRPAWGGGRVNSQTISLAPLDDESTARLLAHVVGRAVVDATTQQAVLTQAGGNPLYAEEFARLVAERGSAGAIPPTVQGVIAARLDVLRAEEKAFLQDAAVLGKVFWRGGVEALGSLVTDDVILSLTRKDILRRARSSSVAGETELAFRHALVRDVAYAQIPRARRANKHRLAAEWIASTSSGRPDLVAHHYVEAIELTRAAGGDIDPILAPAVDALVAAADRSVKLGAPDDALASLERALELAGDDVQLLIQAEQVAQQTQAGGGGAYGTRALEIATDAGDRPSMATALRYLSRSRWDNGDVAEASALMEEAVTLARDAGDDATLALALEGHARLMSTGGRHEEALAAAHEALALAERMGLDDVAIGAQTTIGTSLGVRDSSEAPDMLRAAARRAADRGDLDAVMRARNNLQYVLWRSGNLADAESESHETRRFFAPYRLPRADGWMYANAASSLVQLGRWDEALEMAEIYQRALRGRRFYLDPHLQMGLTIVRFARDEPDPFGPLEALVDPAADLRDAQSLGTPAMWLAYNYALAGRFEESATITRRLAETTPEVREHAAAVFGAAGQLSVLTGVDLLDGVVAAGGWFEANLSFVRDGFGTGVRALDALGARGDAIAARLVALKNGLGEDGWADDVEAFAHEVRATRWLRDVDELRAMPRSA